MSRKMIGVELVLMLGCGLTLLPGCSKGPPSPSRIASGKVNGITYEVWGIGPAKISSSSGKGSEEVTVAFGPHKFEIRGGRVLFDGKDYGSAEPRDEVVLGKDGLLMINSMVRGPAEPSPIAAPNPPTK